MCNWRKYFETYMAGLRKGSKYVNQDSRWRAEDSNLSDPE